MTSIPLALGRVLSVIWRIVVLLGIACAVLVSVVFSTQGQRAATSGRPLEGALMLGTLALGLALVAGVAFRARAPLWITVGAAALSLVLPMGVAPALYALIAAVRDERGWRPWTAAGATGIALVVGVVRDVTAPSISASMLQTLSATHGAAREDVAEVPVWLAVAAVAIPLAVAVGVGLLARVRRRERVAEASVEALGGQLARSEERTRIAREIHDGLGHRLSLLSLQAGALEAQSAKYPELAPQLAGLREQAGLAVGELRSALDVIGREEPAPRLSELATVAEEWVAADQPLAASVFIRDADDAPPELARAVVRIVQEALTNARRHAPGSPVQLRVGGGPGEGVSILVRNRLPSAVPAPSPGGGRGLAGMAERARSVGGELRAAPVGGEFVLEARLPWAAQPPSPRSASGLGAS